jgi:cytoskeletal protein CcmA (bactofilin family)
VTVSGTVVAPSGTVTIDSSAQIVGNVMADRLTLNGGARFTLIGQ